MIQERRREPRYRLADQVPDKRQAVAASSRLDAKLTGANPIDILIEFPKGASLYAPETLQTIADVHSMVETQAGVASGKLNTSNTFVSEQKSLADQRVGPDRASLTKLESDARAASECAVSRSAVCRRARS